MSSQRSSDALVQFDGYYIAWGFQNPDSPDPDVWRDTLEIYLDILNDVEYSMGPAGNRSGGLLYPQSKLVALSRQRGPLGGPANTTGALTGTLFTRTGQFGAENPKAAYASYFPSGGSQPAGGGVLDTKLLGVVTIGELVKAVQTLGPVADGLPLLREVIHYGIAGAEKGAETIRAAVFVPLAKLVERIQARWDKLNADLSKHTPDQLSAITAATLFPEIDSGLQAFKAASGMMWPDFRCNAVVPQRCRRGPP